MVYSIQLILIGFLFIHCQNFAITQARIAQINQFIADVKRNKIPVNDIQSRANNLKKGLSKRELNAPYIKELDKTVKGILSEQIIPEKETPPEKQFVEEKEEKQPKIKEKPAITVPDDLAIDIEAFASEIEQKYNDPAFIVSAEYRKSVDNTYKTLQTQLLKHKKAENFRKYQTIFDTLADQFDEMKKRKPIVKKEEPKEEPKVEPKAESKVEKPKKEPKKVSGEKEPEKELPVQEKPEVKIEPEPEKIPLYSDIDNFAQKIDAWFKDERFIPTTKESTHAIETHIQLLGQLLKQKMIPNYNAYYEKLNKASEQLFEINNRIKPISEKEAQIPPKKEPQKIDKTKEQENLLAEFNQLVQRSNVFGKRVKFPTQNNLISAIATSDEIKRTIAQQAKNTRPIMHVKTSKLISDFLAYKKQNGTAIEKAVYTSIDNTPAFIDRLLKKRPLMFMGANDQYLLRNGQTHGSGGFQLIRIDAKKTPLNMSEYLTYDEMQISALLGVSVPTYFINNGNRANSGIKGAVGSYESQGIYVGLVGARFEKKHLMEWQHMIITEEQNTAENGYGANPTAKNPLLDIWARFYDTTFPTFEEAQQDTSGNYELVGQNIYFNKNVYKKRMRMVVEPFLFNANERGKEAHKKVYGHIVGLGLGVWQLSNKQPQWLIEVYAEVLKNNKFEHIQTLNFSYFPDAVISLGGVSDNGIFTDGGNSIKIIFSKREPAAPLEDADALLVAQYAWDGNAYPGNEYWAGMLAASGDPAAACCSTIPELQNPEINLNVSGKFVKFYGKP